MKILNILFTSYKKIKLIDRCLILFMSLFMFQSLFGLFMGDPTSHFSAGIDIVIRTTSAAIFGYFLSANFITKDKTKVEDISTVNSPIITTIDSNNHESIKNVIGFTDTSDNNTLITPAPTEMVKLDSSYSSNKNISNQQIIITTAIGITSVIALLIARNFITLGDNSAANITHLRDMVSGCVGFLVGCPTNND